MSEKIKRIVQTGLFLNIDEISREEEKDRERGRETQERDVEKR